MLKAALYIRVSTEEQTEYSPSAQRSALTEYAERNNMTVCEENIYSDEGYSGRTAEKRPSFMKMISAAKNKDKPFDIILVHKFDRFARSRETSVLYKEMLKKECGIKVISITESVADEKISIISDAILEAMAEYYSINLSEEVKKGMTEKAKRGGFQTSPPLGYKSDSAGGISIIADEAEIVMYIYEQFVNANKSVARIARELNNTGALTKRGNKFDSRAVSYILKNPLYIGFTHWTPEGKAGRNIRSSGTITVKSTHPPIISEKLFLKAEKKLDEIKQRYKYKARPETEYKHWLSGLIRCSTCGSRLTLSANVKYPSFQCRAYAGGQCGTSHSITLKKLQTTSIEKFDEISAYAEAGVGYVNDNAHNEYKVKMKTIEKKKNLIIKKSERAAEAYLNGIYSLAEYSAVKIMLEDEKNKIIDIPDEAVFSENNSRKANRITDVLLSESEIAIKSASLKSIVKKIVFNKTENTIEIYMYEPN